MKSTFVIAFLLGMVCMAMSQKTTVKAPHGNIDAILNNDRVFNNYLNCLLDKGHCSREGEGLKKLLPDAIQTDCSNCTPDQKRNSKKIINFLRTRRPADWKALTAKYDPESKYWGKLNANFMYN